MTNNIEYIHDDVIKWKHFPRNWPFVRGIHQSPVNSPHKGQWHGALMFSLICVWINDWVYKQSWGWWFETLSRPSWRHRNVYLILQIASYVHDWDLVWAAGLVCTVSAEVLYSSNDRGWRSWRTPDLYPSPGTPHGEFQYIDGLVQDCGNSSALAI